MSDFNDPGGAVRASGRRMMAGLAIGGIVMASAIAGCGSTYASNAASRRYSAPATNKTSNRPPSRVPSSSRVSVVPAATVRGTGIPQHDGGDHDSDNSGGPSDGDGGV